jgi:hypothetical protein
LTRADLSVLGEEEWRKDKPLLVHERWRELAKAQIGRCQGRAVARPCQEQELTERV